MSVSLLPAKKRRERQRRFGSHASSRAVGQSREVRFVRAGKRGRKKHSTSKETTLLFCTALVSLVRGSYSSPFFLPKPQVDTDVEFPYVPLYYTRRERGTEEERRIQKAVLLAVLSVYLSIDHRQREKGPPVTERTIQGRIDGADRAHKCMMTEREGTFWWREGRWEGQAAGRSRSRNNCTKDGQWPHEMKMQFVGSLI